MYIYLELRWYRLVTPVSRSSLDDGETWVVEELYGPGSDLLFIPDWVARTPHRPMI